MRSSSTWLPPIDFTGNRHSWLMVTLDTEDPRSAESRCGFGDDQWGSSYARDGRRPGGSSMTDAVGERA
jgi:hypothetical protein